MSTTKPLLSAGMQAPDFTLRCSPFETVSLSDFRGHAVVLAFYPDDWSPVCSDQMQGLQDFHSDIRALDAVLLGISPDGTWCHQAFQRYYELDFPLLSDTQPRGAVARAYGVFDEQKDRVDRALFVVGPQGAIVWSERYPSDLNPGVDEVLTTLHEFSREIKDAASQQVSGVPRPPSSDPARQSSQG